MQRVKLIAFSSHAHGPQKMGNETNKRIAEPMWRMMEKIKRKKKNESKMYIPKTKKSVCIMHVMCIGHYHLHGQLYVHF